MGAVQALVKSQFSHFQGLKDPILQLSVKAKLSLCPGSLQILHVDSNHWITVSHVALVMQNLMQLFMIQNILF